MLKNNFITIENWNDVKQQFGMDYAKILFQRLKNKVNSNIMEIRYIDIPCSENSEAVALFELHDESKETLSFTYTGTAC